MAPVRDSGGDLVGRAVPYTDGDPAVPLAGDEVSGPIRTADGELVGRTALYQVAGGVAVPVTELGGTAAEQVSADAPLVATPSGDNVTLSVTTDQAGGVPLLDGSGLIKLSQMPISGLNYHGNWDASTNTPTLVNGTGTAGDMYRVHVAGTQDLGGGAITFDVGDLVVYEGAEWQKFEAATGVISVNGKTGAVELVKGDVGLGNVDNTSDADKPISTATQAALDTKLTTPGPLIAGVVLGTTLSTNTIGMVGYDQDVLGDTLVMRQFGGQVSTAAPQADTDAATKAYVDTAVAGAGGGAAWGDITGTLSSQTDLQQALDGRVLLTSKATDADTDTGTADDKWMTPHGVTRAINNHAQALPDVETGYETLDAGNNSPSTPIAALIGPTPSDANAEDWTVDWYLFVSADTPGNVTFSLADQAAITAQTSGFGPATGSSGGSPVVSASEADLTFRADTVKRLIRLTSHVHSNPADGTPGPLVLNFVSPDSVAITVHAGSHVVAHKLLTAS
ncbi:MULTISPECIES: hypothetical protein [unclassified Streptomyces]|uniref:hypothetical protein n=1 Tax=unclassified Streptomyces TaxID=2593676 RepID=UPI001489F0AF|nr:MULTISPECIES: hypothetical protein [unclassified Streptomyces]